MSTCLDNIISIGCSPYDVSLSGLDLFDAPEISHNNIANITNEENTSGYQMAVSKVQLATKLVKNDLLSVLAANNVLPNINDITYTAGTFKPSTTIAAANLNRGLVLHKAGSWQGTIRKLIIKNIYVYPLADATDVTLTIHDQYKGGTSTEYTIDLVGGDVNTFNVEYEVLGTYARVYLNGTALPVASNYLTCFTGCGGRLPNDCGYVKSFYNNKEISGHEGYGINLDFHCECDYDELLCGLSKGLLGNIVWYKARILIQEMRIQTNRLNNWSAFNREEAEQYLQQLISEYTTNWNTFVNSLPSVIKNMRDSCLWCRGTRWVTNV